MLTIIELMHTLLPEPVDPAIRRCGISFKSATIGVPEISLPTANASFDFAVLNSLESKISRKVTKLTLSFSTSIPTAALPGIGASIRILLASKLSAISSARRTILLTFTPIFGWIS